MAIAAKIAIMDISVMLMEFKSITRRRTLLLMIFLCLPPIVILWRLLECGAISGEDDGGKDGGKDGGDRSSVEGKDGGDRSSDEGISC